MHAHTQFCPFLIRLFPDFFLLRPHVRRVPPSAADAPNAATLAILCTDALATRSHAELR